MDGMGPRKKKKQGISQLCTGERGPRKNRKNQPGSKTKPKVLYFSERAQRAFDGRKQNGKGVSRLRRKTRRYSGEKGNFPGSISPKALEEENLIKKGIKHDGFGRVAVAHQIGEIKTKLHEMQEKGASYN